MVGVHKNYIIFYIFQNIWNGHSINRHVLLSDTSSGDKIHLETSVASDRPVKENQDVVVTCTGYDSTSVMYLGATSREGYALANYSLTGDILEQLLRLTREFHLATIQCGSDSGLTSNTVAYSVNCE